ncbi:type II toxin-antitoxin system Phd/YefM family antitoxin [Pseudanabaena sp. FACHB-1277]|jgi:antitoxin YefM|uniref:Antitoxin n=1 Tax=Pseudanabaena cinerea FACHB-1277 TaxID=2949581 RepID=A0A926UXI1_9CYAN|nr:type II toxin-antitoxin system Phd/YefM family antitoxin [Pseudanabaena cinerea]MBD2152879.1 type II toxin-antitoxin system Phd/YefM family antitoxin [Pseudanabaena cinerea FACHB-1277]
MYQVTVDYAKKNLNELCDRAGQEPEGVAIVNENRSYILIAQEEWESLMETAMIMQTPNILQQIEIARQEYLTGETVSMEQIFG